MISNSVAVTDWWAESSIVDEIQIDWPAVHKKVGIDRWRWLRKKEDQGLVVLHLEQDQSQLLGAHRIVAEFTDSKTQTEYLLKFN